MYLEHLQLKSQPFAEHATVSALWQDQRMEEGLARLEYLVQCGQLGLITVCAQQAHETSRRR